MRIVSTTDDKYIGQDIGTNIVQGDLISLGDFQFQVQFIRRLDNGHISIVSTNYQLECEE